MSTSAIPSNEGFTGIDKWIKASEHMVINGQEITCKDGDKCSAYGENFVASGRAIWDVRIDFESFGGICVGIYRLDLKNKNNLELLPINDNFAKETDGYGYINKNGMKVNGNQSEKYGDRWRHGDILSIQIDLLSQTLEYFINGKSQGNAYSKLPRGAYRLALKLQFKDQKVSILKFWTSVEQTGMNMSNVTSSKVIESQTIVSKQVINNPKKTRSSNDQYRTK